MFIRDTFIYFPSSKHEDYFATFAIEFIETMHPSLWYELIRFQSENFRAINFWEREIKFYEIILFLKAL